MSRGDLSSRAWLVDLVFPPRCVACSAQAAVLCARCVASLRSPGPPACLCCGAPTAWPVARCRECTGRRLAFSSARAAVVYAGAARRLVAAWKERGLRRAADLAAELVATRVPRPAADVITYIPPDPARLLARGHHPAEALARRLGDRWQLPLVPSLRRDAGSHGGRQTGLARPERVRNVRGAFRSDGPVEGGVVLVDDVYTTGATAAAAAAVLRRAGAGEVTVVTFARTVRL